MFRVNDWNNTYSEIEPIKVTDKTVTCLLADEGVTSRGGTTERENRVSSRARWFDTEEEARTYIANKLERKKAAAEKEIWECDAALECLSNGQLRVKSRRFA